MLVAQGAYYVATGVWSIAHRRSFEHVTGPKRDYWLVRTVGGLAVAIGGALLYDGVRGRREGAILSAASALAFGAADLQAARHASRVYLADAAVEALLLTAWLRRETPRS